MSEEKKEDTFELSNLFTTDRMNEGVWFEPYSDGITLGVRFKIIGIGSTKVVNDYAKYTVDINTLSGKDGFEAMMKKQAEINADFASKLISNIETSDGRKVVMEGKDIDNLKEVMKKLFTENELVADMIIKFASNDFNYIIQD